jgi:hypothetical protein
LYKTCSAESLVSSCSWRQTATSLSTCAPNIVLGVKFIARVVAAQKTYIFVKLVKLKTILVQNVPSKCSPFGLWTAARLCAKNNKFDVILYQFPDHLKRTFLHNRTAGYPRKTTVSVIFCQLLSVFNMGTARRFTSVPMFNLLGWAYRICKKKLSTRF